jgi:hypothetical protein
MAIKGLDCAVARPLAKLGEDFFDLARIDIVSVADDQMFLQATMKK